MAKWTVFPKQSPLFFGKQYFLRILVYKLKKYTKKRESKSLFFTFPYSVCWYAPSLLPLRVLCYDTHASCKSCVKSAQLQSSVQLQTISWCKRCQKRKVRQSALWRQRAIAWFLKQLRFSLHVDPNHARNHHCHTSSAHFGNRGNTASRPNAPSDARNTCSSNSMQVAFKIVPGHNQKLV